METVFAPAVSAKLRTNSVTFLVLFDQFIQVKADRHEKYLRELRISFTKRA